MTIYRLHVFLLDIAPPIWRRIEVSSETSLAQLHKVLQTAMGWQDYHLHEFEIGGQRYGVPDDDYDSPDEIIKDSTAKLSKALPRKGASLLYTYDFGDGWTHSVVLEEHRSRGTPNEVPARRRWRTILVRPRTAAVLTATRTCSTFSPNQGTKSIARCANGQAEASIRRSSH